jgi:type I restriction enzyme S subunit
MQSKAEVRWVPVAELGEVRMGKQLSPASRASGEQLPYLRVANVYEGRITYDDVKHMGFSEAEKAAYGLKPGDILLNEGQENLGMVGRSAIYDGEPGAYYFQNTLIRFRPGPQVLPEYAQAVFVNWRRMGVFASVAEKTSISHLGGNRFAALPFPVLPLPDQQHITEVLKSVFDLERKATEALKKKSLIRAGIAESLTGRRMINFSEVITSGPQNGLYKPASEYTAEGTPIVRINSFIGGPSDLTRGLLRVNASPSDISRYGLTPGDMLINRVNTPELVGKSTTVRQLNEPTVFESNVMRCRLDTERALPTFAELWLSGSTAKAHFLQCAKSAVSQASISRTDVLTTPFPEMTITEQSQFMQHIHTMDAQLTTEEISLSKLRQIMLGVTGNLLSEA